ncbi:hypothetical protein [Candidatus Accumulibacter sp. ACC003]|uniref:hypothetical protein n=1 Tax=Candidatus Accumulibacter sp. ACC003 TaxID=2823334 RepID=UPI0025BF4200|nr:hypothetical protein [Candidatus Accumulibacter sp. ACC003]
MKRFLLFAAALLAITAPALAADLGVSVTVGQPGFYGRVDIGGYPPPRLVYPQPIFVERVPPGRPPVYLQVAPGHARHWARHCHSYRACGERVYFVNTSWYQRDAAAPPPRAPHYRRYGHRDGQRNYRADPRHDRRGYNGDRGHDR